MRGTGLHFHAHARIRMLVGHCRAAAYPAPSTHSLPRSGIEMYPPPQSRWRTMNAVLQRSDRANPTYKARRPLPNCRPGPEYAQQPGLERRSGRARREHVLIRPQFLPRIHSSPGRITVVAGDPIMKTHVFTDAVAEPMDAWTTPGRSPEFPRRPTFMDG